MKEVTIKKDFIMAEMYEDFRKMRLERKIDKILDTLSELSFIKDNPPDEGKEELSVTARPYEHPKKMDVSVEQFMDSELTDDEGIVDLDDKVEVTDEEWEDSEYDEGPAEEINDQKEENEINHVPNQNADELYNDIRDEMLGEMIDHVLEQDQDMPSDEGGESEPDLDTSKATDEVDKAVESADDEAKSAIGEMIYNLVEEDKEEYQKYFNSMLDKYGVSSPAELDDEKKKEFFDAVDKGWKADHEVSEGLQGPGGKFGFMGEDGHKGYMGEDSNADE